MEEEERKLWRASGCVYHTDKFFILKTYSGYTLQFADPEAQNIDLIPEAINEELGQVLLNILQQSRFLPLQQASSLRMEVRENYLIWIKNLMQIYNYKNKTALFKNMKNCAFESSEGIITIRPSNHETLEGWGGAGISEEDYVHIPIDSPFEDIGAGLRLALSRCIDKRRK